MNNLSNNLFRTDRTLNYYKGASFHFSGNWRPGINYIHDNYKTDFVVYKNVLLACAQSHQAERSNEPVDFIYDKSGSVIGIRSRYWDFVLSGVKGSSPGIKIGEDKYWYICDDIENPNWINTGVKAEPDIEISDEIIEEIKERVIREIVDIVDVQAIRQLREDVDALLVRVGQLEDELVRVSNRIPTNVSQLINDANYSSVSLNDNQTRIDVR